MQVPALTIAIKNDLHLDDSVQQKSFMFLAMLAALGASLCVLLLFGPHTSMEFEIQSELMK